MPFLSLNQRPFGQLSEDEPWADAGRVNAECQASSDIPCRQAKTLKIKWS
jgi:hypothetical protein